MINSPNAIETIDMTMPAVAIPEGAFCADSFRLAITPRINPTIPHTIPIYKNSVTSAQIPNTIAAIAIPFPSGVRGG